MSKIGKSISTNSLNKSTTLFLLKLFSAISKKLFNILYLFSIPQSCLSSFISINAISGVYSFTKLKYLLIKLSSGKLETSFSSEIKKYSIFDLNFSKFCE